MFDLFIMWALIEIIGLLCLPLTIAVFAYLPDRGWAFSKTLGLAIFAFCVWLPLMVIRNLPFSQLFILGVALILLSLSVVGFTIYRRELLNIVRRHKAYIVLTELIFLGMVFLLGWLRSFGPDIYSFEMFMDEGFIASIMRSPHLPPNDMWYAGESINYYYYAHFAIAMLGKLITQPPSIIFNTGVCIFFGLCASGLFGLTSNVISWARYLRSPAHQSARGGLATTERPDIPLPSLLWAIPFGFLSFLMALVFGNLASTRQWWLLHEGNDLYGRWFGPSRVIKLEIVENGIPKLVDATINEFPAFSFLLACFHAHVLALAFTIVAMGVAFNLLLSTGKGLYVFGHGWKLPLTLFSSALLIGGLFVMNGWDYPTYMALALVCLIFQQWLVQRDRPTLAPAVLWALRLLKRDDQAKHSPALKGVLHYLSLFVHILFPAILLVAFSLVLFLPFYLTYASPSQGLGMVSPTMRSLLSEEILIYGLFAFLFLSLLLAGVLKGPLFERSPLTQRNIQGGEEQPGRVFQSPASSISSAKFPIAMEEESGQVPGMGEGHEKERHVQRDILVAYAPLQQETSFQMELNDGDEQQSVSLVKRILLPVGALVYLVFCILTLRFVPNSATFVVGSSFALLGALLMLYHLRDRAHAFTFLLGATAFALVAFSEIFFIRDPFAGSHYERMNTVFKFYFQAWVLLSVACAAGLYFIVEAFRPASDSTKSWRITQYGTLSIWSCFFLLLVAASMIYPLTAPFARYARVDPQTSQYYLERSNSLDGMEYLQTCKPPVCSYDTSGDYAAIRWLNENVQGDPVIVESIGGDYTFYGRISAFTGLSTPMGWWFHEYQWRVAWINNPEHRVDFDRRSTDVDQIYTNSNSTTVLSLLERYNAQYLYVGELERQKYTGVDLDRFASFMQVVYNARGVTIYKVR